ncbi:hypothetical protein ACFCWG_18145 [Streptomyces sp. NPDC056390]|uniref:hypothetical protein n=1 Tax=Streptomyces sp. NPDC056390 TaxID=3345806 RepID=UPI0035D5B856
MDGAVYGYEPSRAGSEALSRIMAADLRDTGVTVNLLLLGARLSPGCCPPETVTTDHAFLGPEVMGSPIVWLASDAAAGLHDERIVAAEFGDWLRNRSGQ